MKGLVGECDNNIIILTSFLCMFLIFNASVTIYVKRIRNLWIKLNFHL